VEDIFPIIHSIFYKRHDEFVMSLTQIYVRTFVAGAWKS